MRDNNKKMPKQYRYSDTLDEYLNEKYKIERKYMKKQEVGIKTKLAGLMILKFQITTKRKYAF